MGKRELKNEILTIEDVFKVIEFIAFGISNNFISRQTPLYWEKAVDEFHRNKSCGITYFKRTKGSFPYPPFMGWVVSQNAEHILWQGFSPDKLTPPSCGRDVCWTLDNNFANFLEAIYEFKINHL